MGCWNETCAVSNLPIQSGEPTVALILGTSHAGPNDACVYPDDFWAPIGFPLFGRYNDYGSLECVTTHPWNQKFFGIADTPEQSPNNLRDLGHFDQTLLFVHEEIYRTLVDAVGHRIPCGKTETYRTCLTNKLRRELERMNRFSLRHPFDLGHNRVGDKAAAFFREQYAICADEDEKSQAIETAVDCQLFQEALTLLRKGYRTISGTGSQTMETALHILVARFTIEHAQNMFLDNDPSEFQEHGNEEPLFFFE